MRSEFFRVLIPYNACLLVLSLAVYIFSSCSHSTSVLSPLLYINTSLTYPGRLVRLIPSESTPEKAAIKALFNHRLSSSPTSAREEWLSIVEGHSPLWTNITSSKRELIRSFLNTINLEIVKRARPSSIFDFQSASVGNLFLTGARLFTGSFESAIYLLGSITGVPENVHVIPAINSNFSHHISAGLEDGTIITGQNAISHPLPTSSSSGRADVNSTALTSPSTTILESVPESPISQNRRISKELSEHDRVEDANLPGSLPTLRKQYITFHKSDTEDLPSRIERIWYINPYGQEIRPAPNQAVLGALGEASAVVYSIGSLYTSVIPGLILRDVGIAVGNPSVRFKILILNGSLDRETRAVGFAFGAKHFVKAIADACCRISGSASRASVGKENGEECRMGDWKNYVTHVVHLNGEGTPRVEREELAQVGVECVRIYGRKNEDGEGMLYDGNALRGALEAILGGPRRGEKGDGLGRRNTLNITGKGKGDLS